MIKTSLQYPSGPVSVDSLLYIPRPPIEDLACQEITKPGAVIRIRAPKKMGKSSLGLRIVNYAESLGYQIATIDFQQFDAEYLKNLDRFLRSFCLQVTRQLGLEADLDEYWDEDIGSKVSCSLYFCGHLLEQLDGPLVLVLNEVNQLFEYPQLTQDFLPLLRSWYEEGKQVEMWQKIRLMLVYNTEVYVAIKITQSPFNIGLPLTLPDLTIEQVEQLAQLHQLDWNWTKTEQLMAMVGGHPLLVQIAMYHLSLSKENTLENILASATLDGGIYQEHLQRLCRTLEADTELKTAFQEHILAKKPLGLQSIFFYKLEGLGLVKRKENQVQVSYELYRQYFERLFQVEAEVYQSFETRVKRTIELEQENARLRKLCQLDPVTQVGNRPSFDEQLVQEWQLLSDSGFPLSLMLCQIDCFKLYNDYYGSVKGNNCLRQVAQAFREVIQGKQKENPMLVYRYEGSKFAVLVPRLDRPEAVKLSQNIQANVKRLGIELNIPGYACFPDSVITVTVGVATIVPDSNNHPETLIIATEQALVQSQKHRIW